jgi:integrase
MSLLKRGGVWHYDFWLDGRRYRGSTGQRDRLSAQEVETKLQTRLRRQAAGLEPMEVTAPAFAEWAEIAFAAHAKTLRRPEAFEVQLRLLLRFWGRRPANEAVAGEPYHDLTLQAPITDPAWLIRFEAWMGSHAWAPGTRNHLRSTLSTLYQIALRPQYRAVAGVTSNPARDLQRERGRTRTVTITPTELRSWLQHASYHVRLAIAIGALAPKLRLAEVLALEWRSHVDLAGGWITSHEHKTAATAGRPHVVPISEQLRAILDEARRRHPFARHVITYRGRRVRSVRAGVRAAAMAAGLAYGRLDGITFHTLRHAMATLLAELGAPEHARAAALGHADIATTQRYTHLRPHHERPVLEQLAGVVPIVDVVNAPGLRAVRARQKA